jgi:hypothetical protein
MNLLLVPTKGARYSVHALSVIDIEDITHPIEKMLNKSKLPGFFDIGTDL